MEDYNKIIESLNVRFIKANNIRILPANFMGDPGYYGESGAPRNFGVGFRVENVPKRVGGHCRGVSGSRLPPEGLRSPRKR